MRVLRVFSLAGLVALSLPSSADASARLYGQGLLWRIDGFGYEPSYVFGTMHVSDERVLALPEPVLQAFDAARICLFELIVPDDGFTTTVNDMLLPHGITLPQIVGIAVYDKVRATASRYGFTTRQIVRMHPAGLIFAFQSPPDEWRRRLSGAAFLDQALQNEALALNKPIAALETIEEQMAVDDGLGQMHIAVVLNQMAETSWARQRDHEVIVQHYLRADLDAFFDFTNVPAHAMSPDERRVYEEFNERLLDRRNIVMVQRMEPFLRQGRAFVAIGAAHLSGKMGVLHLLEGQGYRVTRIY
jgi:hypothetical protein